ncbi:flavin reductase [Comamonas sp. Y33R10-2]|uniref:flavin reductase n=1 Tax=Comamonas sp. Y33R10-2 TaxID=2853257 RepID=UPI001C5CBDCE|nr:flavin reductase [Comamonas sp. Y33R10-2]QXZ08206.1 flavin reductase [Comamonas sp. Y33R10-2]
MSQTEQSIANDRFRSVLGSYPTGVAVVTGLDQQGEAIGMVVGTFTSVSMNPPLVAFLPMKTSRTFQNLREASDKFSINILAADQEGICRTLASPGERKFDAVDWHLSPAGNPIINGVVAWIDCEYANVLEGGDHFIVLGSVKDMGLERDTTPLLFFQRGYGSFSTGPMVLASERETLQCARLAEVARNEIESLANELQMECSLVAPVGNDAVYVAVANHNPENDNPSHLGVRVPLTPPLGTLFIGHENALSEDEWIARLGNKASPDTVAKARSKLSSVQARGWSASLLGNLSADQLEQAVTMYSNPQRTPEQERHFLSSVSTMFDLHEPDELDINEKHDMLHLSVPVRKPNGEVALALRLSEFPSQLSGEIVHSYLQKLQKTAVTIEHLIAAQPEQSVH